MPGLRESLAEPSRFALFNGLYTSTSGEAPHDNSSSDGRRARATYAKNAAFVVLTNRKTNSGQLLELPIVERAALVTRIKTLLAESNPTVEPFASFSGTTYTEWQWRSKELIDYLVAYDLLRGAGESAASLQASRTRLQQFAGNLYLQSNKPFLGVSFYGQVKNNHTLMTAAALGMAAVVLNEASSSDSNQQPTNWINVAMYTIDNVLWQDAERQSDPQAVAGYAEGPYYFKYAFLNCLPFFRAMGNFLPDGGLAYTYGGVTRTIRNPYFDPRYDRLYDWVTAILLPDGRFPALEDSYMDMGMPELALTGKANYVRPLHLTKLDGRQMNSLTAQLRDVPVDMRAAYLAAQLSAAQPEQPRLTTLPQSGNLVFRSGSDSLASYLHLYGKNGLAQTNSGGHSHADAGSFILHAYGQLLALDPGYLSYNRRAEVGNAGNHNMLLVDGDGPAMGTAGAANDAAATIQHTFSTPQLAYGEVQTAYKGTSITRKALFIRNSYYLLADVVQANTTHIYTWQLHGYGLEGGTPTTGSFQDNLARHEGTWHKNGVSLLAHVTAAGGATYSKATNVHEVTYNTPENHTTLLVQRTGAQAQFLAALYPYATTPPAISTTSTPTTAGLTSTNTRFTDIAFTQTDTTLAARSGLAANSISSDALLTFYSRDLNGGFAQAFLEEGKLLQDGLTTVLSSSRRATISWQKIGSGQYAGHVSRGTTLTIGLAEAPLALSGPGVSQFAYDAATQQLRVVLTEATDFQVQLQPSRPLPVELVRFTGARKADGVQLTWQTATELHNRGFAVERRTATRPDFQQIGFVAGQGASSTASTYRYQDLSAPAGETYYRLRQLNQDGTSTYSSVVVISAQAEPLMALTVAPIPARSSLTVTYPDAQQIVHLKLLDQNGRTVSQQQFQAQTQVAVGHLPAGVYYLQSLDAFTGQPLAKPQRVLVAP
ncbi:heparinase II/III domain-containing protein [Hymenobacter wooponensis]|uniref:T9SS type A sorting domain-containing protein n=1 Tax=Hymenobacter wooponensis TaxID=1525360 RepID=A0A4Z0MN30_9BACT|nr:heparinase II/III family protein [Hymenobacter wooponensis]TGD80829.1 T9SS type A sorting domain-containing protein [Hymenobacter wooponensis]